MSRVGKLPVKIAKGIEVSVNAGHVAVKSAKGQVLNIPVQPVIDVKVQEDEVVVTRKNDEPKSKAFHGLFRALIQNAVTGLSKGWSKTLIFKGVGYKAGVVGKVLEMNLGYSHPVKMDIPEGLQVAVEKNNITVSGADRAQVGQFSAQIRNWRKPEPYLGKGIRYSDEVIRRKQGKSGSEKK